MTVPRGHHSPIDERDLLTSLGPLLRETLLATLLTWLAAVVGAFALSTVATFLLQPVEVAGFGAPTTVVVSVVWAVAIAWAIGSTTRMAAWDEVGDRAALQSLRVLAAAPWLAAMLVALLVGVRGTLPPIVAAPLFGATCLAAVLACVHRALGVRGAAAATVLRVVAAMPRASAALVVLPLLAELRWISGGGASRLELVVVVVAVQLVAFAMVDTVVGVPRGAVRTRLGRRGRHAALALAWPADAGAPQLVHLGVLDRALQARVPGGVTLQRLRHEPGLRTSRWFDLPHGGELWVALRTVDPAGVLATSTAAVATVLTPGGDPVAPTVVGAVLARYRLPPGSWEFEVVIDDAAPRLPGHEVVAWRTLVPCPPAAASDASPPGAASSAA